MKLILKLMPLMILMMMSLKGFSQNDTLQSSIQLKKPIAKLVIKDLITGDGAKEELAILTREMKSLAKKYSKAEGQEKEDLLKKLKSKTKLKKELDKILDK